MAHKVWQGLSKGCAKEPSEAAPQLLRLAWRRDTVIASTKTKVQDQVTAHSMRRSQCVKSCRGSHEWLICSDIGKS